MSAAQFLRPLRRGAAGLIACLCLLPVACAELGAVTGRAEDPAADRPRAVEPASAISPDLVPEPAVFEATGSARWDGRRTLQGVWVAHPKASGVRRVRIYNAATGAIADGALFTRKATLSGPSILVSSEVATLLGMTPGVQTELRIVALSDLGQSGAEVLALAGDTQPAAPAQPVIAAPAARQAKAPATPAAHASSEHPARATPAAARPDRSVAVPAAATPAPASVPKAANAPTRPVAPAPDGPASSPAKPRATTAAAPDTTPQEHARPTSADRAPDDIPSGNTAEPAQAPAARDGAPPADALAVGSERMPATASATSAAGASPTRTDAGSPPARTPPQASLAQPYVQAGIFSVPDNARRLVGRIEAAGMPAVGRPAQLATGPATRVLAGPFSTAVERDAARRRIQQMGLRDAVPVAR
jgi:rare lipoprotein A